MSADTDNLCEHCRGTFATKKGLKRHQLTAKYCAKTRNAEVEQKFKCPHCDYGTCFRTDLNKHVAKCAVKNKENLDEKEIERLKKELSARDVELIRQGAKIEILEKMAERPNVNITNNTNITLNMLVAHSMQILSPYEELLKKLPELVAKHVVYDKYKKGINGIASALINGVLRDGNEQWLVCYEGKMQDFHEKKFGQIEVDQRASDFFEHFAEILKPKIEEFSKRELYEADDSEDARNKALERKRKITGLCDPLSLERKRCVKNMADAIYLSKMKMSIQMKNNEQIGDSDMKIVTDKVRIDFFKKNLSEYHTLSSQIYDKMRAEFTRDKFLLGFPGLVEACKRTLMLDGKISIAFFDSKFQFRDGNDICPMETNSLIKDLTISLIRSCNEHADEEDYPNDVEKSGSLREIFKKIKSVEFSGEKLVFTSEWQKFVDLLAESLTISDEEILAGI